MDVVYNVIGSLGVLMLLSTYFLLQTERIQAQGLSYSLLNFLGSGLILISLLHDFNLPSFLIESAWAVISIVGLLRWFGQSRRLKLHD